MNIFAIPTNRLVASSVSSLCQEIESHSKNEDNTILILDNSDSDTYNQNIRSLEPYRKLDYVNIKIFNSNNMNHFAKTITDAIGDNSIYSLIAPQPGDYGRIFNMLYLYVILSGNDSFHRRDSDCFVNELNSSWQYPLKRENDLLGKRICDVSDILEIRDYDMFNPKDEILITGSDYYGDWNLDIKDLSVNDDSLLDELFQMMHVDKDVADNLKNAKYKEYNYCRTNRPILKTSKEVSTYPECGNIAMKRVFEYIPNFVGKQGIGFDYHTYLLSHLFKVPTTYHENKILHKHDNVRSNDKTYESRKKYLLGIIKQIDIDELYHEFIVNHLGNLLQSDISGLELIKRIAGSSLPDALETSLNHLNYQNRKDNILRLSNTLGRSNDEYSKALCKDFTKEVDAILTNLDADYSDSIRLQRRWKDIVNVVKNMHVPM